MAIYASRIEDMKKSSTTLVYVIWRLIVISVSVVYWPVAWFVALLVRLQVVVGVRLVMVRLPK